MTGRVRVGLVPARRRISVGMSRVRLDAGGETGVETVVQQNLAPLA